MKHEYVYYKVNIFGLSIFRVDYERGSKYYRRTEYLDGSYYYGDNRDIWRKSGLSESEWDLMTKNSCESVSTKDINKILMMEQLNK